MQKINVTSILGTTTLLSAEKGLKLLKEILKTFKLGAKKIVVDFNNYNFISSTFINQSFGKLCIMKEWDLEEFKRKVEIVNLDDDDYEDIILSILNAEHRMKAMTKSLDTEEYFNTVYTY